MKEVVRPVHAVMKSCFGERVKCGRENVPVYTTERRWLSLVHSWCRCLVRSLRTSMVLQLNVVPDIDRAD